MRGCYNCLSSRHHYFSNTSSKSLEQDTSLQITGQQQENRGMDEAVDWRVGDAAKVPD